MLCHDIASIVKSKVSISLIFKTKIELLIKKNCSKIQSKTSWWLFQLIN